MITKPNCYHGPAIKIKTIGRKFNIEMLINELHISFVVMSYYGYLFYKYT